MLAKTSFLAMLQAVTLQEIPAIRPTQIFAADDQPIDRGSKPSMPVLICVDVKPQR